MAEVRELNHLYFIGELQDDAIMSGDNAISFNVLSRDDYRETKRHNSLPCVMFLWKNSDKATPVLEDFKKGNRYFFTGKVQSFWKDNMPKSTPVVIKVTDYIQLFGTSKNSFSAQNVQKEAKQVFMQDIGEEENF